MSPKPASKPAQPPVVYQLRIELQRLEPLIWRRLLVPSSLKLAKLDRVLQAAMGWNNSHLHEWLIEGQRYGIPDDDWGEQGMRDDRKFTVGAVLHDSVGSFTHNYDFGDGWEHQVTVEQRLAAQEGRNDWPMCIAGENACPPDDVGGPDGYLDFLRGMRDPRKRPATTPCRSAQPLTSSMQSPLSAAVPMALSSRLSRALNDSFSLRTSMTRQVSASDAVATHSMDPIGPIVISPPSSMWASIRFKASPSDAAATRRCGCSDVRAIAQARPSGKPTAHAR